MNKTTYQKEDLIWEATRRNEYYKALYGDSAVPKSNLASRSISEKSRDNNLCRKLKLRETRKAGFEAMSVKLLPLLTKIREEQTPSLNRTDRNEIAKGVFKNNFPADPDVDIDAIREQIDNGADPKEVHPYHGFFEKNEETRSTALNP